MLPSIIIHINSINNNSARAISKKNNLQEKSIIKIIPTWLPKYMQQFDFGHNNSNNKPVRIVVGRASIWHHHTTTIINHHYHHHSKNQNNTNPCGKDEHTCACDIKQNNKQQLLPSTGQHTKLFRSGGVHIYLYYSLPIVSRLLCWKCNIFTAPSYSLDTLMHLVCSRN